MIIFFYFLDRYSYCNFFNIVLFDQNKTALALILRGRSRSGFVYLRIKS